MQQQANFKLIDTQIFVLLGIQDYFKYFYVTSATSFFIFYFLVAVEREKKALFLSDARNGNQCLYNTKWSSISTPITLKC